MTQEKLATPAAPPLGGDQSTWKRRHLLDVDDFSVAEIDTVMATADAMKEVLARDVPRVPALRGQDDHHPLLRSQHPHTRVLRACRQGARCGRDQRRRRRLQRREGRVARRHRAHAAGRRRRRAGHATPGFGRAIPRRPRNPGLPSSTPATAGTPTRRRRSSTSTPSAHI